MNRGSATGSPGGRGADNGFNEAPIHESGKCQRAQFLPLPSLASMRPRFMNRGSRDLLGIAKSGPDASMRPRFMNRGSLSGGAKLAGLEYASMRPRFMNRGSDLPARGPVAAKGASMRPRFMNRGRKRARQP